jgi:tRNA 2-thiouridine synthesizing protein A
MPRMTADLTIDAIGLLCPLPVLRLRKRLKLLQPGQIACLLADDPAAAIDVPHFCAEQGHAFLGDEARPHATAYFIRKA